MKPIPKNGGVGAVFFKERNRLAKKIITAPISSVLLFSFSVHLYCLKCDVISVILSKNRQKGKQRPSILSELECCQHCEGLVKFSKMFLYLVSCKTHFLALKILKHCPYSLDFYKFYSARWTIAFADPRSHILKKIIKWNYDYQNAFFLHSLYIGITCNEKQRYPSCGFAHPSKVCSLNTCLIALRLFLLVRNCFVFTWGETDCHWTRIYVSLSSKSVYYLWLKISIKLMSSSSSSSTTTYRWQAATWGGNREIPPPKFSKTFWKRQNLLVN